jgi:peptide/nickel transport system substrate-binding protein
MGRLRALLHGAQRVKYLLVLLPLFALASSAFAADPDDCGTIVVPTGIGITSGADITSFNPLLADSLYNAAAANLMYAGLIWINGHTEEIDWSRSLASAISSPDNGTTYNVTLRPWRWSDGVPVTTADVAYTFQLIKQLGATYVGFGAGGMPNIIKSLNIISPTQFQVVLTRRVNPTWYIYNGLEQLMPLPAHSWGKHSLNEIYQSQSTPAFFNVVDGPLRVQRLDIGLDLVMVPNAGYEGPKLHFQKLIFKFLESDGATLQAIESGDTDMANAPIAIWNAVQHLPGIHIVHLTPALSYNLSQLNLRNPDVAFFRDVRVRDAIQDAINEPEMIQLIDHGLGVAIYGPVPPVPATFLSPEMRAGKYPVGYDPQKARALLREAGFTPGPDGIMQKDGKPLTFTYLSLTGDVMLDEMTEMMQAYLAKIGIRMKVREIEFNQLIALLTNPNAKWESAGLGQSMGGFPSGEDLFGTSSYENAGGYSDPKMDKLISESTDQPGLAGLYAYENYASAQQPVIFMELATISMLVRDRIHGAQNFIDPAYNYYPDQLYCPAGAAN